MHACITHPHLLVKRLWHPPRLPCYLTKTKQAAVYYKRLLLLRVWLRFSPPRWDATPRAQAGLSRWEITVEKSSSSKHAHEEDPGSSGRLWCGRSKRPGAPRALHCHEFLLSGDSVLGLKGALQPHIQAVRRDPSANRSCHKVTSAKQDFNIFYAFSAALQKQPTNEARSLLIITLTQKSLQQNTKTKFK